MKKAFDANVSRAKPRLRLGALIGVTEEAAIAQPPVESAQNEQPVSRAEAVDAAQQQTPDLAAAVRARVERSREPRPLATEAVQRALDGIAHEMVEQIAMNVATEPVPVAARSRPVSAPQHVTPEPVEPPVARSMTQVEQPAARGTQQAVHHVEQPVARTAPVERVAPPVVASFEPLPSMVEVQTPSAPSPVELEELSPDLRRERLKSRLKAVRENPRPEPMPPTVAETGIRAVERISVLQTEVTKLKALNLALTQDLEAARRTAEKATEEARSRMDEAQRLTRQMEERAKLLSELERELSALEGERDESLLQLQEARQSMEASAKERVELQGLIAQRDQALADSLSEEEKLAEELEAAHDDTSSLRRTLDAVNQERDTLARQVSELTSERAELLEARRALEAVHRALSQAAAR